MNERGQGQGGREGIQPSTHSKQRSGNCRISNAITNRTFPLSMASLWAIAHTMSIMSDTKRLITRANTCLPLFVCAATCANSAIGTCESVSVGQPESVCLACCCNGERPPHIVDR